VRFRFVGEYTNGREEITVRGITFHGHDPKDVEDKAVIDHLRGHSEFETVTGRPAKD